MDPQKLDRLLLEADCVRTRADALAARCDEEIGALYRDIRKRAEKRGWEATVGPNGVRVSNGKETKTIKTMEQLEAFMGD